MLFPQEFFDLNLRFAKRIAEVSDIDFATALLKYTHLYMLFGLGRSFDPANVVWQAYIAGVGQADDPVAWTYQFYVRQQGHTQASVASPFGCFSYSVWNDNRIRLHFHNADKPPDRPLSKARLHVRLAELRRMFVDIRRKVPNATNAVGGSWLYNLEAYRRLFPIAYLHSAHRGEEEFPYMALWGQFLAWNGKLKQETAQAFLDCLQNQSTLAGAENCFPFPVLRVECPVEVFHEFYQVPRSYLPST